MAEEQSRLFGTHYRSLTAGPFDFGLSRATVAKEHLPEHRHEDAHFILAIDAGYQSRAFDAGEIGQGLDLIYNPPGTEHRDCFFDPGGRFLSVGVPAAAAPRRSRPLHLKVPGPHRLAAAMLGLCARGAADSKLVLESSALELLGHVSEKLRPDVAPSWLARADELIDSRATDQAVTVSGIAGELRIHPVYFARAYRAARGENPAAAIHRRRLRAVTAMLSRDIGLSEIAFACGFSDQSHLTRSVSRMFGLPPSALRAAFD